MPYEVLLKKAHELVDAAPPEKIEWVVGVLEGEEDAREKPKKITMEDVNAFLEKHGQTQMLVGEAGLSSVREFTKNDVW